MSATPRSMTALTMRRFSRHRMALAGAGGLGLPSLAAVADRKRVEEGKSVDLGGRRII